MLWFRDVHGLNHVALCLHDVSIRFFHETFILLLFILNPEILSEMGLLKFVTFHAKQNRLIF